MATKDPTHDGSTETKAPTQRQAQTETETVTLPAIGTIIGGRDDDPMVVVNHADELAGEYTFPEGGEEKTLTEAHGCPPNSPVVETIYLESLDRNVPSWRGAYVEQDREEFVEWLDTYCAEWGINESVLKRYGYSKRAIHDMAETVDVEIEL